MSDRLKTPNGSLSKKNTWLQRVRASTSESTTTNDLVSTAYDDLPRSEQSPVIAIKTHREREYDGSQARSMSVAPPPTPIFTRDERQSTAAMSSGSSIHEMSTQPPRGNSLSGPRPLPGSQAHSSSQGNQGDQVQRAHSSASYSQQRARNGHQSRRSDAHSLYSQISERDSRLSLNSSDTKAPFTTQTLYKFGPNGEFPQPKSTAEIEHLFTEMMSARDLFRQMPDDSRRQLMAKPLSVKWQMIYADAMTVWKDQSSRKLGEAQGSGSKGSPDWYVKRIVDQTLKPAQYTALNVCLRTLQVSWVREFVENQGHIALTTALGQINQRTSKRQDDITKEHEILKCLKVVLNNQYGAEETMNHQRCIDSITISLISPNLPSRKLVVDVLSFFCAWRDPGTGDHTGHDKVMRAFDRLKEITNTSTRFESWMHIVEQTIDGRGIAGSRVGASDELKSIGSGRDATLMEYALSSAMLVNQIAINSTELQVRMHIRTQLKLCGWPRIATKLAAMGFDLIDRQLQRYSECEEQDLAEMEEIDNTDIHDIDDPVEIVQGIWHRLEAPKAREHFLSTLQHLLLVREQDDDRTRMFQLIDAVLTHIVMDSNSSKRDMSSALGSSLREVMARLATDEEARRAIEDAREAQTRAEVFASQRDMMESEVRLGADGLVQRLKDDLKQQNLVLAASQRQNNELRQQISNLSEEHRSVMQKNEVETRELYMMLKEGSKDSWKAGQGILDRKVLMSRLERQLEHKKTEFKLEGRRWGDTTNVTNEKLRQLRAQMENLQMDAREIQLQNAESDEENEVLSPEKMERIQSQFGSSRARTLSHAHFPSMDSDTLDGDSAEIIREKPRIIQFARPKPVNTRVLSGVAENELLSDVDGSPSNSLSSGAAQTSSIQVVTPVKSSEPASSAGPPPPPPPPPALPSFESGRFTEVVSQPDDTSSAPSLLPPPPPPPGPAPSLFGAAIPSAPGPPPPPPPPPPMPGASNTSTIAPPPPPPPMPNSGSPTQVETGTVSVLDATINPSHTGTLGKTGLPLVKSGQKQLATVRPQKKLKQMHFDKLDTGPQYTLWAESKLDANALYVSLSDRGLLEEIEKSYSMREIKLNLAKRGKKKDKKTFLSSDIQQRIGVSFHRWNNLTVSELVGKILRCEDDLYTPEMVDFLADEKIQNQDQAKKSLRAYSINWLEGGNPVDPDKDSEELMREDQIYLSTFVELSHYWARRMGALKLRDNLERNYKDLQQQISIVTETALALRNSQSFREVLNVVLHLGNYMNDLGKQAEGFKLGTLARLPLTKNDANSKQTFMHTLERVIRTVYPQLEDFLDELKDVGLASKINIESLSSDIKQLIIQTKVTQRALETGDMADKKVLHPKDRIRQVIEVYLPTAIKKTSFLTTLLEDMESSFDNCLIYYCEEPRDSSARSQFFQKFDFFIKDYKRVKKENFDMEEEAHRADMRRKALLKAGQKNILDQAMNASPNHAVMDNLLEKLRVGPDPEARRTRKKNMLPARRVPLVNRSVRRISEEQVSSRVPSESASETGSLSELTDSEVVIPEGAITSASQGNNTILAARAQSMLAGLRSGKVVKLPTEETSSDASPIRLNISPSVDLDLEPVKEESTANENVDTDQLHDQTME